MHEVGFEPTNHKDEILSHARLTTSLPMLKLLVPFIFSLKKKIAVWN